MEDHDLDQTVLICGLDELISRESVYERHERLLEIECDESEK